MGGDASDNTPEGEALRVYLATEAVGNLVARLDPGTMPGTFALVIETVDRDGVRALWTLCSEGAKPWDTLGLLEAARLTEQAATLRDLLE